MGLAAAMTFGAWQEVRAQRKLPGNGPAGAIVEGKPA